MVDPAGTPAQSGRSAQVHLKGSVRLGSLAGGRALRVFVEEVGAGGSVVLRVEGKRFRALTGVALRKGEWYVMRSVRSRGETRLTVLQQIPRPVQTAEIARAAGLPSNELSEAVIRAFLRSGLSLGHERLRRVYSRFLSRRSEDPRRVRELVRLDSLLVDKGLEMDGDTLETILSGGHHFGRQGSGSGRRDSGDGGRRQANRDSTNRIEDGVRNAFRLGEEADHPLQLFNHVIGRGDHWVIIPVDIPESDIHATLRLRVPRSRALGSGEATVTPDIGVLVVQSAERTREFRLTVDEEGILVQVNSETSREGQAELERLENSLHDLGCSLVVRDAPPGGDDGFSDGESPDIMTSVDSSA